MPQPSRRSAIAPFIVMQVLADANRRAAAGESILHLEVGEPAGGAPPSALAAARLALEGNALGYTEALGLPALRARIAQRYDEWYGLPLGPDRIAVTTGASGAFILAFLAAFDAGARVAVASPGYPAYRNILGALDIEVVDLPTDASTRFQPTPARLDALPGRIDGLVVASPANPTGTMLSAAELAALGQWCARRDAWLVSDEIYHGLTFEHPAASALATVPDAIVVNSFSKYFCMTGWRLGWLVTPPALLDTVTRLAQNLFIAPPAIAQHAALGAFADDALLAERVHAYGRNRDRLLHALLDAGIREVAPPDGAFYLYADIAPTGLRAEALCARALAETGVAITPGTDFDPVRGDGWIRLSFAGPEQEVAQAAERLGPWLKTLVAVG
ncbi:MAG: aminotransferase class I/II-fold pyridoxal phosphate-dependent enzyme [Geminicoccaceae bacterium]